MQSYYIFLPKAYQAAKLSPEAPEWVKWDSLGVCQHEMARTELEFPSHVELVQLSGGGRRQLDVQRRQLCRKIIDVSHIRVDQQVPHRLPGLFGLLCLSQPHVQLVHGALQLLESLQGSLHLTLPAPHVPLQTLPPLHHLARLLADRPGQTSGLLLWGEVWKKKEKSVILLKKMYKRTCLWLWVLAWLSGTLDGLVSEKHPGLIQSADHQMLTTYHAVVLLLLQGGDVSSDGHLLGQLLVAPALVHVIQSVLEEHCFLRAAQSLDHLRLVPIHTLVDVIVGIDFSLDVLQIHKQRIISERPFLQGE
ncbi:hypothetical protein F7725_019618, partial [Dissostichus mawsoni]